MAFEKGKSGNRNGRPKGSKNKGGEKLRDLITGFLEDNFNQVVQDFDNLTPRDRMKVYTDLLQYAVPKLQAVNSSIRFEDLTEEQLDEIINRLKGEE